MTSYPQVVALIVLCEYNQGTGTARAFNPVYIPPCDSLKTGGLLASKDGDRRKAATQERADHTQQCDRPSMAYCGITILRLWTLIQKTDLFPRDRQQWRRYSPRYWGVTDSRLGSRYSLLSVAYCYNSREKNHVRKYYYYQYSASY